jgi:hypothetical protein
MICHTPVWNNRHPQIADGHAYSHPDRDLDARRMRCPKDVPRVMIEATGAKNGAVCPGSRPARNHAIAAVTEHYAMSKDRCFQRSTRRPAEAQLSRSVRSLRSNARSFIRCTEPAGVHGLMLAAGHREPAMPSA